MFKFGFWGVLGIGVLLVGILMLALGGYVFRWYSAPFVGALEEREITNKGAYRIQAYNEFYSMYTELDGIESKITLYDGRVLHLRDATNCRGLVSRHADIVSEYNSEARAVNTTGQWLAEDLPVQVAYLDASELCDD